MSAEGGGADPGPWHPPARGTEGRTWLVVAGVVLLVALGPGLWAVTTGWTVDTGESDRVEVAEEVETEDLAATEGDTDDAPTDEAQAANGLVAEFSGDGDAVTDVFEVQGRWQIRWTHEGEEIDIALLWEDPDKHPVIFTGRRGGGTAHPSDRGELALQITTDGRWELSVYETVDDD